MKVFLKLSKVKAALGFYFFNCIQNSRYDKQYFFMTVCLIIWIEVHSYGNDGTALIVNQPYGLFPLSLNIKLFRSNGRSNPDDVQSITVFLAVEKMVCFLAEAVYFLIDAIVLADICRGIDAKSYEGVSWFK